LTSALFFLFLYLNLSLFSFIWIDGFSLIGCRIISVNDLYIWITFSININVLLVPSSKSKPTHETLPDFISRQIIYRSEWNQNVVFSRYKKSFAEWNVFINYWVNSFILSFYVISKNCFVIFFWLNNDIHRFVEPILLSLYHDVTNWTFFFLLFF